MYGIAVLTDNGHDGKSYAECMKNYCTSAGIFPLVEIYKDAEMFFRKIQDTVPDLVFLVLPAPCIQGAGSSGAVILIFHFTHSDSA